jgi:gluconolactonase
MRASCRAALLVTSLASTALAAPDGGAPAPVSHPAPHPTFGSVERLDPALDALIPAGAKLENLAEGFDWIEGPVWVKKGGYLLFSEIPLNLIYRWSEHEGVSVFMKPSGDHGGHTDLKEPGTNGLAIDRKGNLVMCEHGDRRVARLASWAQPSGKQIPVADRYQGKRFNSPNDLVVHSSGDIFFTDPPYGLGRKSDPAGSEPQGRELSFQGVFRVDPRGKVSLVYDGLERPNGIGLSPDEKILYVANSFGKRPIWMAFDLAADRSASNGRVFFDAAPIVARTGRRGGPDGFKVDVHGNLFASGPGGIVIISPQGKHLGTILTGLATPNCAFGDDGSTLYIMADTTLARIKTTTRGLGF